MELLTDRQQQIMDFIRRSLSESGVVPSVREIAQHFNVSSPRTIQDHLKAIIKKGHLEQDETKHRGLRLKNWKPNLLIPLLGQVQAGLPVLAEENIESYISIDREMSRGERMFALKVRGDSMQDAGIFEEDQVIIKLQETAQNGDIVVALLDGEATIKYYRQRKDRFYLEPANPNYDPFPADDYSIIGKVVGLIRNYHN